MPKITISVTDAINLLQRKVDESSSDADVFCRVFEGVLGLGECCTEYNSDIDSVVATISDQDLLCMFPMSERRKHGVTVLE